MGWCELRSTAQRPYPSTAHIPSPDLQTEPNALHTMPTKNKANNPFAATAPNQVLCVESRPLTTKQDGTLWVFMAMDAYSRFAVHHTIARTNLLPDYVGFLFEAVRKDPTVKGVALAIDARPDLAAALHKVFPHFVDVISDQAGVYEVTDEFHVAFMAHMASQGRGNY